MYHDDQPNVDKLIENLRAVVGRDNVLSKPDELLVYECDGLPHHKHLPRAVVFPSSTDETSAVMQVLSREQTAFTPRGAGTGLSGGALALNQAVVVELARMRRILKIDETNRFAVVQPGVVNAHVSRAVAHLGLHYVPDPSSQPTCTIGGNIAENAGGIHCLKYGTTTDHVLGIRVVLAGGEIVDLGDAGAEMPGYDLTGVFIGSEGTFGIATEATLRLTPIPPAVRTLLAEFDEVNDASHAVSAIIAAGVMPAALEMMDKEIIRAVEASVFAAGLSLDIGAALLIELDGIEAGIDDEAEHVRSICLNRGARSCRSARDEAERKKLWAARKGAFGAVGRISPDSMIQDAVVPRSRLPEVLAEAYRISSQYQLRLANVFHAGDGNLHPLICFDSRSQDEVRRVKEAGRELMEVCVRAGGSITGEHGVGYDKRELLSLIFSETDLEAMLRVRQAFDPTGLCNPGKIIPMLRGCGEGRAIATTTGEAPKSNGQSVSKLAGREESLALEGSRKPSTSTSIFQRLEQIVGEADLTELPLLTVHPKTIEAVCEVMKIAAAERLTVAPAAGALWPNADNHSRKIDLILNTRSLNLILEHEPADLIAVTQAGVTLRDFNSELKRQGQWLPLDPPDNGQSTIGGVVATGLGGAQQFGYGAPRRHVIGMKVVLADGTLINVGGRVVKNVAGYDLCKLFTGSYGTLGIIVQLNFKLRPLPFETATVIASGTRDQLAEAGTKVITSRLFPTAVELLSPGFALETGVRNHGDAHSLLIRFAGSSNAIKVQTMAALKLLSNSSSENAVVVADDDSVWQKLGAVPFHFPESLAIRTSLRPADLRSFLAQLDESDKSGSMLWHAGVGDGRVRMIETGPAIDTETGDLESSINNIEILRKFTRNIGGSLVVESAPTSFQNRVDAWGQFGNSVGLMKRIKHQLDPQNILSPSRFSF